jgi:hypothetical protein
MCSCWEEHICTCHSRGRRLGSQVLSRHYLELYLFFVFLVGKGKHWSHPGFFAVVVFVLVHGCLTPIGELFFVFLLFVFWVAKGKNLSYPHDSICK